MLVGIGYVLRNVKWVRKNDFVRIDEDVEEKGILIM